jgi:hypothetical protein
MTKREKQIGIGVLAVVGAFALDQWAIQPYWDAHAALRDGISSAQTQLDNADRLFKSEVRARPKWKSMIESPTGIKSDWNASESQAQNTVLQWATAQGVNINNITTEGGPRAENKFLVINFHATGSGTMQAVSKMLNSVEIGQVPLRIDDIQINSRPEGSDNLTIQMSISTLCLPPATDNSTKQPVAWLNNGEDRS